MTHQPNCDKNTKACAVSHTQGTPCLDIPCNCKAADLPSLIESGIAEFFEIEPLIIDDESSAGESYAKFLKSFATKAHNAAIDSALEALPEEKISYVIESHEQIDKRLGFNKCLNEARAKLSALKKENV